MNNVERIMAKNKLLGRNYDIFNTVSKEKLFNNVIDLIMEEKKSNEMLRNIPRSSVTKFVLEVDRYGKIYSITPSKIITSHLVSINSEEEYFDNFRMLVIPDEFKENNKIKYYQTKARYRMFGHGLLNDRDDEMTKYYSGDMATRTLYNEFFKEYYDKSEKELGPNSSLFLYFGFALMVHYFDTHSTTDYSEIKEIIENAFNNFENILVDMQLNLMTQELQEIQLLSPESFDNSLLRSEYNISFDEFDFGNPHKKEQELLLRFAENYVDTYGKAHMIPIK